MIRLNLVVEGQTEETFVNGSLAPHLANFGVVAVARCVETGRKRGVVFRGGLLNYEKAKGDIVRWMKEDSNEDARFTTMFDLYALPDNFPGFAESRRCSDLCQRVEFLECSLANDVEPYRFIPYIQPHEFEALLFADVSKFALEFPGRATAIANLEAVAAEFLTPEHIDDDPATAPSKRILKELPDYRKAAAGPIIAGAIGLPRMREACPHFNRWLSTLEGLGQQS